MTEYFAAETGTETAIEVWQVDKPLYVAGLYKNTYNHRNILVW